MNIFGQVVVIAGELPSRGAAHWMEPEGWCWEACARASNSALILPRS